MAQEDNGDTEHAHSAPVVLAEPIQPKPEPAVEPAPPRRGFWGPFAGGIVAAAAGFGLAQLTPSGWPLGSSSVDQTQIAAQQAEIVALKADLAALAASTKPDASLPARIAGLEEQLATPAAPIDLSPLESRLTTLESRMTTLEAVPLGDGGVSPAQMIEQAAQLGKLQEQMRSLQANSGAEAQTAAAQALLQEVTTATDSMKAEAAQMLASVRQTAAIGKVQVALDLGGPFDAALADLTEVPAVLTDTAATGVPTLDSLQIAFPAVARAALEAALRADMGSTWSERLTNFLRAQTGARSLDPRDGADPDAVLSRIEASLSTGDLATVLTEIAALPEPAQAAMAEWTASAQTRQAAEAALAQLVLSAQQ